MLFLFFVPVLLLPHNYKIACNQSNTWILPVENRYMRLLYQKCTRDLKSLFPSRTHDQLQPIVTNYSDQVTWLSRVLSNCYRRRRRGPLLPLFWRPIFLNLFNPNMRSVTKVFVSVKKFEFISFIQVIETVEMYEILLKCFNFKDLVPYSKVRGDRASRNLHTIA